MRRIYLTGATIVPALIVALLLTVNVSATTWESSFIVKNGAKDPDVAIDSTGGMHFVWWNPQRLRIQYRHCTDVNTCEAVEQLPVLEGDAYAPALALDAKDRPNVVWEQHKGNTSKIYYSRRGGSSWTPPDQVSNKRQSTLADIAIGDDEVKHIVYQSVIESGIGIYYVTRGSSSNTVQLVEFEQAGTPEQVAGGRNVRVAVDQKNRAHIVWNTAASQSRVKYTYQSADGAFVTPIVVADQNRAQAPELAIDRPSNRVGIIWESRQDQLASFALYRNGERLFRQTNITGGYDSVRHPRLAADCGGRFHIVFQRQKLIQTDWNVFHRVFNPADNMLTPTERVTEYDTDDITPVIATSDFVAIGYVVSDNNTLHAVRGDVGGICYGDPTPAPTPVPTAPPGWQHIPNHDARIVYTKGWITQDSNKASESNYARCQKGGSCQENASAELVFTGGTRIEWVTAYANNYGKADVYLDGEAFEVVDLCALNRDSDRPKFAARTYILSGNYDTPHSIKIVAVGHTGCSNVNKNFVAVDGFNILR